MRVTKWKTEPYVSFTHNHPIPPFVSWPVVTSGHPVTSGCGVCFLFSFFAYTPPHFVTRRHASGRWGGGGAVALEIISSERFATLQATLFAF